MASFSVTKVFNFALFSSLFLISIVAISAYAYQFQVGGEKGWVRPTANDTQTYNNWAAKNRFHIGDTVYFKYRKDSVVVVNKADYENCVISNPISKFEDGNTVFRFDHYGYFYFISGQVEHCKSGQKMIIRVMVHSGIEPPESAPSPKAGGGGGSSRGGGGDGWDSDFWGPPGLNSTTKLSAASFFMTALGGVLVILYLLM
ncbi:early nodulin-like protein 21 [Cornus florida]|uniref:early nodulin-like protein 21 n=1 Tax=Cornus florida TaxID=4283 RepID=UPI00289FE0BA|nr:early nodulin-like protein 21 [Cornus florida]